MRNKVALQVGAKKATLYGKVLFNQIYKEREVAVPLRVILDFRESLFIAKTSHVEEILFCQK